ncbi:putative ABC transporter-associated repeat protein [Streptomyces zhaozhouensis]|uniref:Putative ABC transporter-associated repeat protein n=1 Tax=Streptomyces zhaozhouensis TaxID=1300267 RepID=A0A286DW79_9ACTN|nr:choice-of-anchor M domain-containing protein [Streptomyces zhaozhouensis]SOD62886.1 putative ABC transporter-associated repeat protein [Streptomyces zhaozhouensis]
MPQLPAAGVPYRRPAPPRARWASPLAALAAAPLVLLLPAAAAHADEDGDLEQTVAPEEENVRGEAVLDIGHVDIGPRFVDGEWHIQGRDDSQSPPVWRGLTDVVTRVVDAAVQQAPDNPDFAFLDAEPGSDVHVIPQTQAPEVVWLGWNTQDPEVMERVNRGVTLTMHGMEGPGHLAVFLQNGDLGAPEVLWDGDEPGPQELWVDLNTHTHANWVFTEPGVYVVDFEVSADLITGETVSDRAPLRFAVGEGTDLDEAFAAELDQASPASQEPPGDENAEDRSSSDETGTADEGSSVPAVLAVVGAVAVALAAAVVTVTVRGRRARRIAAASDEKAS